MLTCKDIAKIASSENPGSWKERMEMKMHLLVCDHCSKYAKQLKHLKTGIKIFFEKKIKDSDPERIKKIEQDIIKKIKASVYRTD